MLATDVESRARGCQTYLPRNEFKLGNYIVRYFFGAVELLCTRMSENRIRESFGRFIRSFIICGGVRILCGCLARDRLVLLTDMSEDVDCCWRCEGGVFAI